MPAILEAQIEAFFDGLQNSQSFLTFARRVEESGHSGVAHVLRAAARSEEIRHQLMRGHLISVTAESDNFQVCPHCGLITAGDAPEKCPVDSTPGSQFEKIL